MQERERQELLSRNDGLRDQIESMYESFDQQRDQLAEVKRKLEKIRVRVKSSDRLVEVVANSAGAITEVHLAPEAFRNNTPERLAFSINEAIRAAIGAAVDTRAKVLAPVTEAADAMPDLNELIPGAPSMKDIS